MRNHVERTRRFLAGLLLIVLLLPALAAGEEVRLRDGSTMRGRLVSLVGDTLVFRLNAGPEVKLRRSQVLAVVFDDSLAATGGALPALGTVQPAAQPATGTGRVSVVFKDRQISSKISIKYKKEWDAHVRSNWIVTEFIVDGDVVYTAMDTTMDKNIYEGHVTQLKNEALLEDFVVTVPAGIHQCQVVVRNYDEDTFREEFDPEPLHMALVLDTFEVPAGHGARIEVGINRGTLRLGKAKLYRVE